MLPGVAIVVSHQESGVSRETTSGADGSFFVTGLLPGPYRVSAKLDGFRALVQDNVILRLGATSTVDLQLLVGGIAENVTVTGEAAQVDLTSAQGGGSIRPGELQDLPSQSRGFVSFLALLPGVQYVTEAGGDPSVNVNGQHDSQLYYVVDGGTNNDGQQGGSGGGQTRVSIESVQEFQIITNQFDAEYGRSSGGVVNAITKQGTNAFRGSAFGFFTDSSFTAPDVFSKRSGLEKPDSKKQQFGATFGGPIVRNKAHFFTSFERIAVDFGKTRLFPTRPELSFSAVEDTNFLNLLTRVDYQVNARHTLGFRWITERAPNHDQIADDATESAFNHEIDNDITAVVNYNRILGNTRVNTMRLSYAQEAILRGPETESFAVDRDMLGEPPTLDFVSFIDQSTPMGQRRVMDEIAFDNTFSWFVPGKRGDHDLKFGMQYLFRYARLRGGWQFQRNFYVCWRRCRLTRPTRQPIPSV